MLRTLSNFQGEVLPRISRQLIARELVSGSDGPYQPMGTGYIQARSAGMNVDAARDQGFDEIASFAERGSDAT